MEKMAHDLSLKISSQLHYDDAKQEVIEYGLTAAFQIILIFLITSVVGILGHFWYESVVIFFVVGIMKKSTGGAHLNTMLGCTILSVFSISLLALTSRYVLYFPINIYLNLCISAIIFVFSFIVFYKRVPLDSPNKPITKPEKIKKLRFQSFILLSFITLCSVALIIFPENSIRLNNIIASIRFALLWQTFTLTKVGSKFMTKVDQGFSFSP